MLENGFVKAYDKMYCKELPRYQGLNLIARTNKIGLYQEIDFF